MRALGTQQFQANHTNATLSAAFAQLRSAGLDQAGSRGAGLILLEKLVTLTPFKEIALIENLEGGLVVTGQRNKERLAAQPEAETVNVNGAPRP